MPLRFYDSKEGCDGYVARLRNEHKTDRHRHATYATLLLKTARVGTIYLAMSCFHCSKSLQYVRFYTITCVARHRSEHKTDQ